MLAKIQIALFLEQQGIPISGSIGICRDRVMTVKWYWCRKTTQIKEFWDWRGGGGEGDKIINEIIMWGKLYIKLKRKLN